MHFGDYRESDCTAASHPMQPLSLRIFLHQPGAAAAAEHVALAGYVMLALLR